MKLIATDKSGIIALLENEGDKFAKWWNRSRTLFERDVHGHMDRTQDALRTSLSPKEHEMHHRAAHACRTHGGRDAAPHAAAGGARPRAHRGENGAAAKA